MITFTGMSVQVTPFKGTDYQADIVSLAVNNYGFIVSSRSPVMVPKQVTFGEFADIISEGYDLSTPQNAEVVKVLREVHHLNQ